jgi:hypothetical protein
MNYINSLLRFKTQEIKLIKYSIYIEYRKDKDITHIQKKENFFLIILI